MGGLIHPTIRRDPSGRLVEMWTDPAVQDTVRRLHHGDPSCGWEGDENLVLYLEKLPQNPEPTWVLERLEDDGQYHVVCRARPGADVRNLPRVLVTHDRQRGHDAMADVMARNERARKEQEDRETDALAEKMEKVYWALGKDVGHHYG